MLMTLLAVTTLAGFQVEQPKKPKYEHLVLTYAAFRAIDRIPTEIALSRVSENMRAQEANFLAPKTLRGRIAMDLLMIPILAKIDYEVSKQNPKAGKIVRIILGTVHIGVGGHNLYVAFQIKK